MPLFPSSAAKALNDRPSLWLKTLQLGCSTKQPTDQMLLPWVIQLLQCLQEWVTAEISLFKRLTFLMILWLADISISLFRPNIPWPLPVLLIPICNRWLYPRSEGSNLSIS